MVSITEIILVFLKNISKGHNYLSDLKHITKYI